MKRTKRVLLLLVLLGLLIPGIMFAQSPQVVRIAFTDPPTLNVGEISIFHPSMAAMLAFKGAFERYTNNRFVVELYPFGVLGDAGSNLEQMLVGTLEGGTPAEGALAPFFPNIQVLSIPYIFSNALVLYDVLDGPFGQRMFEDMARTAGLRVLAAFDNGGFRHFTNSRHPIRSAEDMRGLRIRTMDIPIHMEMVRSLGASPTPIAFLELYGALQTGVVDGQENSAITILGASLNEVQRYVVLDGHLLGMAFLTFSERWFQSLSPADQEAARKAGREAAIAARGVVRFGESLAIEQLRVRGMEVHTPTESEMATFREATQEPAIRWLRENVDTALVDELITLVAEGDVGRGSPPGIVHIQAGFTAPAAAPAGQGGGGNTVLFVVIALISGLAVGFVISRVKKA